MFTIDKRGFSCRNAFITILIYATIHYWNWNGVKTFVHRIIVWLITKWHFISHNSLGFVLFWEIHFKNHSPYGIRAYKIMVRIFKLQKKLFPRTICKDVASTLHTILRFIDERNSYVLSQYFYYYVLGRWFMKRYLIYFAMTKKRITLRTCRYILPIMRQLIMAVDKMKIYRVSVWKSENVPSENELQENRT